MNRATMPACMRYIEDFFAKKQNYWIKRRNEECFRIFNFSNSAGKSARRWWLEHQVCPALETCTLSSPEKLMGQKFEEPIPENLFRAHSGIITVQC
jgi:hypothetical protein